MAISSLRVLVRIDWPNGVIHRLYDGSGPFMDLAGDIWLGCRLNDGLDEIESALNGEAATLYLSLSGVDEEGAGIAFDDLEEGNVIGGRVQLLIQPCDQWDQPEGEPEVKFTGTIDNATFDDTATDTGIISTVSIEITNRFALRRMVSGAVLSDVDQRARSAVLNPTAPPDRFAERITGLADKTIIWPRNSGS